MNTDTSDFLETLLWIADRPEHDEDHPLKGTTIRQFSQPFKDAVSGFIAGFRQYLEACDFDMDRLEYLERSFGGNVYFSLSGHGCGFRDEYSDPERTLGDELHAHLVTYAGNRYRFEGLDSEIDLGDGTIDLSIRRESIDDTRSRKFLAPWVEDVTPTGTPDDAPRVFLATVEADFDAFTIARPVYASATGDTPADAVAAFYTANRPASV